MTATPESIAEKYAKIVDEQFQLIGVTRQSFGISILSAIREALAPVLAERDAARADLAVIEEAAFDEVRFGRGCEANSPVYCHWYDDGYPYTGTGPTVAAACRAAMEQKGK